MPAQYPQIPAYIGTVIAITLLGWGIGGLIGGVIADYFGRKRTMIFAILAYSVMTGLTALVLRLGLVRAAALPRRHRDRLGMGDRRLDHGRALARSRARQGAGLMQCGLGIGFFVASFVWLFVGDLGPNAWRYMYLIGILPALLTLWIRVSIPESGLWQRIDERRRAARERQRTGAALAAPRTRR